MNRLDRQSFLGPNSDAILNAATIGLVGLGGGGSHVGQQTAHMGIGGFVNVDPDVIEDTNTNRLIGGTLADVAVSLPKVTIVERLIRGLQPNARIIPIRADWRDAVDDLKLCDVIVGAVDDSTSSWIGSKALRVYVCAVAISRGIANTFWQEFHLMNFEEQEIEIEPIAAANLFRCCPPAPVLKIRSSHQRHCEADLVNEHFLLNKSQTLFAALTSTEPTYRPSWQSTASHKTRALKRGIYALARCRT